MSSASDSNDIDASETPSLAIVDLSVHAGDQVLLKNVDAQFPAGQISVIVGGSGAGKSILLRILAGLLSREDRDIQWSGEVKCGGQSKAAARVGIVFQQFALFDELSSEANVQFAIDHRDDAASGDGKSARDWLHELRVPTGTKVANLSGGQKQRLAIARTLAARPSVILYDEPTSGLDAASGRQVADLIKATQQRSGGTSIVVTHDYETLLPIADHVFLLNAETKSLQRPDIPESAATQSDPDSKWSDILTRIRPVPSKEEKAPSASRLSFAARLKTTGRVFLEHTGTAVISASRLPLDAIPRRAKLRWLGRFVGHYLHLVAGPSAWIYMLIAGLIVGFSGTYFTFRYLPFASYTKPLLIEDLLGSIGFALYRILVPVIATILIAARCGAAVSADVGVKKYGLQIDALRTFGIPSATYLLTPILIAFTVGTPLLEWIGWHAARIFSLATFLMSHPNISPHYWNLHFISQLQDAGPFYDGAHWVLLKNLACGIGVGAISYHLGIRKKESTRDVSDSITAAVLWTTLFVLFVHFVVAFFEF